MVDFHLFENDFYKSNTWAGKGPDTQREGPMVSSPSNTVIEQLEKTKYVYYNKKWFFYK